MAAPGRVEPVAGLPGLRPAESGQFLTFDIAGRIVVNYHRILSIRLFLTG
jgi:hypothetical protein